VRQHRAALKQDYGILLRSEIHAHEFVSGRGRMSAERIIEDPVFKQCTSRTSFSSPTA
jgi:hypothetical protein